MNRLLSLTLALAAGLLGSTLSRYVNPATVLAQEQSTTTPKEIRAQRFTLVNEDGAVLGVFGVDDPVKMRGIEQKGDATIKLFDENGRETFRAGPPVNRLVGQK